MRCKICRMQNPDNHFNKAHGWLHHLTALGSQQQTHATEQVLNQLRAEEIWSGGHDDTGNLATDHLGNQAVLQYT